MHWEPWHPQREMQLAYIPTIYLLYVSLLAYWLIFGKEMRPSIWNFLRPYIVQKSHNWNIFAEFRHFFPILLYLYVPILKLGKNLFKQIKKNNLLIYCQELNSLDIVLIFSTSLMLFLVQKIPVCQTAALLRPNLFEDVKKGLNEATVMRWIATLLLSQYITAGLKHSWGKTKEQN